MIARNQQAHPAHVPGSNKYIGVWNEYNHKNERTFRGGSWIDRQYVYDEDSHLIGEYKPDGSLIVEYVWLDDKPVAAIYPGNKVYWIVTDHQNVPRRLIDRDTKAQIWAWNPDAFGRWNPVGSIEMNLRFPGQYYDEQSGLFYNHNRYYNPELGRYMEPDPLALEAGLNMFAYAGNNPVMNVDPSGLKDYSSEYNWGWMAPEASFSQNQTWYGVQSQFQYGSGTYYADPMQFDFQKVVDIPQQIQTSALTEGGYFNKLLAGMGSGEKSSFQYLEKSIGGDYFQSIQTKAWPFGRVITDTYGSITKNADQTYFATGVISFRNDTYSWKPDGLSLQRNIPIVLGGMLLGGMPSVSYLNTVNQGEMPVSYPRSMWFSSMGNWQ